MPASDTFSIITPSLNSVDVITDCINSIAQLEVGVEHLVIDGESTDGTRELVEKMNGAVRVVEAPPEGIYPAINTGITHANGEVIGILNADDFYANGDVLRLVSSVFEDPTIDACYGDLCYVDKSDPGRVVRFWRAGQLGPNGMLHGWMPPHPTFFVRRRVYEDYGLYRTDLGTSADYELMLRFLVKHQVKTVYIPEILVHMRTGGASNKSWKARIEANRMDRKAWQVNALRPYPWTMIAKPLRKIGQWWSRP